MTNAAPQSASPLPSLAPFREANRRLAEQNARVVEFVDSLPAVVDRLVCAAGLRRWGTVRNIAGEIAVAGYLNDHPETAAAARAVVQTAAAPDDEIVLLRSVMRLVGQCGRCRRPQRSTVRS